MAGYYNKDKHPCVDEHADEEARQRRDVRGGKNPTLSSDDMIKAAHQPPPGKLKEEGTGSSLRKRSREKRRREEFSVALGRMAELLPEIDPSLRHEDGTAESCLSDRIELIKTASKMLESKHEENENNKRKLHELLLSRKRVAAMLPAANVAMSVSSPSSLIANISPNARHVHQLIDGVLNPLSTQQQHQMYTSGGIGGYGHDAPSTMAAAQMSTITTGMPPPDDDGLLRQSYLLERLRQNSVRTGSIIIEAEKEALLRTSSVTSVGHRLRHDDALLQSMATAAGYIINASSGGGRQQQQVAALSSLQEQTPRFVLTNALQQRGLLLRTNYIDEDSMATPHSTDLLGGCAYPPAVPTSMRMMGPSSFPPTTNRGHEIVGASSYRHSKRSPASPPIAAAAKSYQRPGEYAPADALC